jgi:DNA-directed RNA polymerase specialized sigma24 family protein
MVTSQGESPDTSSGSRQDPTCMPASETVPSGNDDGGCSWVPAGSIEQAEAALAQGETESDNSTRERLLADQRVVDAVRKEGLRSARHQALEEELIRYAIPVLKQLLATGQIRTKCHRLGRPLSESHALHEFTADDLDDFAQEMVAKALPVFTEAVFEDRRWAPHGGAGLTTYFINGCVMQFQGIYRKWRRDRQRTVPRGLDLDPDVTSRAPDPAVGVADADRAKQFLAEIADESLRKALAWRAVGCTAREAADRAGLTVKAAEGRLSRHRKSLGQGVLPPRSAADGEPEGRHSDGA